MNEVERLDRRQTEDILGLTPVQEGMLFHYLNEPKSQLYFEQLSYRLDGNIDLQVLKRAWKFVIESNEILRTVFRWENLNKPVQIILKNYEPTFKEIDLSSNTADYQQALIDKIKHDDREEKIELTSSPYRIIFVRINSNEYEMIISNHHILYDGWSNGILLKELLTAYNNILHGIAPPKPIKAKYKEYIKWINSQDLNKHQSYWTKELEGFDTKSALPIDRKKQKNPIEISSYTSTFSEKLTSEVNEYARKNNMTLATLLYGAWAILLHKYNNSDDVLFGTTISGRTTEIKGIENIIGLFINTPPLRIKINSKDPVSVFLKQVDETIRARQEYETTPLTLINQCSPNRFHENLFDSIFVIENYPLDDIGDLNCGFNIKVQSLFEMDNYDLTVIISTSNKMGLRMLYDPDLFDKETIETIYKRYEKILKQLIDSSETNVALVNILDEEEINHFLFDFNNSQREYPNKSIVELFEKRVEKTPNNTAVIFEDISLSYLELNERANQLARLLINKGVGCDTVVGVLMDKSIDMIVTLLAILKAGGAYLPIEPNLPKERMLYMLNDSGGKILITNSESSSDIPFTYLSNFASSPDVNIKVTKTRKHIENFNLLPIPDRSLINMSGYKNKIGMASINNCMSLQTSRGCPYRCLYCHKIWSKNYVFRPAENIFDEIQYCYRKGVTNFSIIDDCFNLNMENGTRLFQLIIENKLDIKLFFPNGLRGDILTSNYIDLMVEAGTRGINLSLETASPRLQKLLLKNLDLDKFRNVIDYIAKNHPEIILELATMHGFPTETEEEAMMTLNFLKDIRWIHFPYVHILKIFPNTEMEAFALEHGISKDDILASKDRAFHELPETLPFPKSFTRKYQADFMNDYFLSKERLKQVLPTQLEILDEDALIQKYNAYLPSGVNTVADIIDLAGIKDFNLPVTRYQDARVPEMFTEEYIAKESKPKARRILLLDLSQHFSTYHMLYRVTEQPLGLIYLLTYLKQKFGDKIDGRIWKSGIDFNSFEELRVLISQFNPELIGIRTLTYFQEFFHDTVSVLRQWGINAPIITGGPYASSDYDTILKDNNVNLVVLGEGEYTLSELLGKMLENGFKIPDNQTLSGIDGLAYVETPVQKRHNESREIIFLDRVRNVIESEPKHNVEHSYGEHNLAYVMYTSGSTGKPKGVMVEHRQVNNCIYWMQYKFNLTEKDIVVQRTDYSFDPSVWEIFWPLYIGASVKVLTSLQSRDAEYLTQLMSEDNKLTVMYCPATLVNVMTYILNSKTAPPRLKLPWLVIGAEPISMGVVRNFYSYYDGKIVNTYGPTECTINNTFYELEREDKRSVVPIGKPISNNYIYILSKDLQIMPLKTPGEICIGGDSVARGYINNPQKTSQCFLDNPYHPGKLYKTGDIGRWLEDGTIEILGRTDTQVKLRGYRIELGEIERELSNVQGIEDYVVTIKNYRKSENESKVCKKCGISSNYPDIKINTDNVCNICESLGKYLTYCNNYFKTLDDLKHLIQEKNKGNNGNYDCILVYACERVATYALYKLAEMGLKVLTVTYDPGHIQKTVLDDIKRTTQRLGVDHIVLTHERSNQILRESLATADTMCKGCIHTSTALAGEYALKNNIKVVIGETLSRGQIIENKLFKFFQQGVTDIDGLEAGILEIQKNTPEIDKGIFDLLNIDSINDRSLYDQITFVDFYRYCDVSNEDMVQYLNNVDSYWKDVVDTSTYSTNCFICQVGDFNYYLKKGYHYNGSAKSWERRLGHISLEQRKEDLTLKISQIEYEQFLNKIAFQKNKSFEKMDMDYLCGYFVSDREFSSHEIRTRLAETLPDYMIPTYFVKLDKIPRNPNGKVDKNKLPEPLKDIDHDTTYVPPENDVEKVVAEVWQNILTVSRVGKNDNFFELGGHSLNAMQIITRLREIFKINIPLSSLFKKLTVGGISEEIIALCGGMDTANIIVSSYNELKNLSADEIRAMLSKLERA